MSPGVHQPTLLGCAEPAIAPAVAWTRTELGAGTWVDVAREWLAGADELAARLITSVPWRQGRRRMWDRMAQVTPGGR